jgi:hypothetical protein
MEVAMRRFLVLAAALLLTATAGLLTLSIVFASNAYAVALTVNMISGEWTDVVGGLDVTNNGPQSNPTAAQLRWGGIIPTNPLSAQSGYDFLSAAPVAFDVNTGDLFAIGTFTHFNNPISSGSGILSANLRVFADVGGVGNVGPFTFFFDHTETPNDCDTSPSCSDDIVTISNLTTSAFFESGDELYTLSIAGFSTDGGNTIGNIFSSPEGQFNTATLYGAFVRPVPLPPAVLLFLSGLAALFMMAKRRVTDGRISHWPST